MFPIAEKMEASFILYVNKASQQQPQEVHLFPPKVNKRLEGRKLTIVQKLPFFQSPRGDQYQNFYPIPIPILLGIFLTIPIPIPRVLQTS